MSTETVAQDKVAIRELVELFADAATRMDVSAFAELWSDEPEWVIGEPLPLTAKGLDAVKAAFKKLLGNWSFFAQFAHSAIIDVRGDRATARCTCEELGMQGSSGRSYHNVAQYFDELKRTPAGWRFSKRSYEYLWLEQAPLTGRTFPVSPLKDFPIAALDVR